VSAANDDDVVISTHSVESLAACQLHDTDSEEFSANARHPEFNHHLKCRECSVSVLLTKKSVRGCEVSTTSR
jgi:hypothetical protein